MADFEQKTSGNTVHQFILLTKLTLKPKSGGLEQLVTNLRSFLLRGSLSDLTTSQNMTMVSWVSVNPFPYFVFCICHGGNNENTMGI